MPSTPKRFDGKHVLVTGAAQGIGCEIARQFAAEGARLTVFDWKQDKLKEMVARFRKKGYRVNSAVVDVSTRRQVFKAVEAAEKIAPIDVLINNAGTSTAECDFIHMTEKDWRKIIDINLTGMFFMAQAACRYMVKRRRGAVVNMGSICSFAAEFGYANYNVSKSGVIMLTQSMAIELAHLGIRVNAVCPGRIATPLIKELESSEVNKAFVDRFIPLNRDGTVEDVAPAFLFLASEGAKFITGQVIIPDGGQLAGMKASSRMINEHLFSSEK